MLNQSICWLAVLSLLACTAKGNAQESLRLDLKDISKAVADVVKKEGQKSVALGPFTSRYVNASAGSGIKQILTEELSLEGVAVSDKANLEVNGRYFPLGDKKDYQESSEILGLQISVTIVDGKGAELATIDKDLKARLSKTVKDKAIVAQVLGVTQPDEKPSIKPKKPGEKPANPCDGLKKWMDKPTVAINGPKVKANMEGKYAIEVHVLRGGKYVPLTPTDEGGFAFARLEKTDVFAINLINDSDYEAATELTVDGLSNFAFFDKKGFRHMIVPPKSSVLLKGWQRNLEKSDEFVITDYAMGAVKELGASPDGVGTITVRFAAAWDARVVDPDYQGDKSKLAQCPMDEFGSRDTAAGRGNELSTPVVTVVREIGRTRDIISVRYKKPEGK